MEYHQQGGRQQQFLLDLFGEDRPGMSSAKTRIWFLSWWAHTRHDQTCINFLDYGTYRKAYQKIINKLEQAGIETVLLNLTPVDTNAISNRYELDFFRLTSFGQK